jgi:DNA-binding LacI/PurR family transcriptional regulator
VTIATIAQAAGVSVPTVSRLLLDRPWAMQLLRGVEHTAREQRVAVTVAAAAAARAELVTEPIVRASTAAPTAGLS